MLTRPTFILAAAAILVSGCKGSGGSSAAATDPGPPTINVVPDQVDRVRIKWADKPEVALQKRNGSWFLTAPPPERPAKANVMADILANLAQVKVVEKVNVSVTDDVLREKELAPNMGIHVLATNGTAPVADVTFGKSTAIGQLARGGGGGIWTVKGYSAFLYMKTPADFVASSPDEASASAKPASSVTCKTAPDVEDFCQEHGYGHGYACSGGTVGDVKKAGVGCQYIDPVLSTHPGTAPDNRFCCERPPQ